MFDIGFSELMVIALVALVVVGPERLPSVARTLGHLFGRLQRYVNDVKADINHEIELEELRKFKDEFEQAAHSMETQFRQELHNAQVSVRELAEQASVKPETKKTEAELAELKRGAAGEGQAHEPAARAEPLPVPADKAENARADS